jgi:hypothetical protein
MPRPVAVHRRGTAAGILGRMIRTACILALCLALPGCVAAIGNRGYGPVSYPPSTMPLLQERVDAARRIVELRQRQLDELRRVGEAGGVSTTTVVEAEIAVEEARLRLLECRAELSAVEARRKDDD